ncbi:putative quinol monooxygenase [Actinomadura namibiensis]|uniref:Quinol monooxygenase YgiN n=1 Tax=Actinomadura namibiensis TaxID=182080 RepID=A0A7W3LTR6_ACTNM|nr:antibiotic biosynthesis monooxygenase [Actinomadura namibiensis]MBA8954062.1 quinol monooxygenase YgiN [Actinomadura namibiensis]
MATGLLVQRASKERLLYLIAWSVTLVGLSLALLALTAGFFLGFNGLLFRVAEVGAALVAPLWLALGMVELIARPVQVRFAAWLFSVSYTVVAMVILALDPFKRSAFTKGLPKPGDTYDAIPLLLIDGIHVVAVLALVACAAVTAVLASKQDREAADLLIPIALVALAGALVVGGTRGLLPGFVAVVALGGAAGLVWYGAMRTIPVYDEEGYADDGYEDEPATGYEEQGYTGPQRQPEPPRPAPAPAPAPAPVGKRAKRGELRFPEPQAEELRFPAEPSPPTTVDGLRPPTGETPLPVPAGADLSAACGQITVYTLLDGREEAFDRLAADLVRAARAAEPDTLIFACHEVVGAPTQRIFYWLFRDEAAFAAHRRQQHLQRFMAESRTHVLATNVIELRLGAAKLPGIPGPPAPATSTGGTPLAPPAGGRP